MKTRRREKSMLFAGPLVRAIQAGNKTQTRRLILPQPTVAFEGCNEAHDLARELKSALCSALLERGQQDLRLSAAPAVVISRVAPLAAGDRLWVREKWGYAAQFFDRRAPAIGTLVYAADGEPEGASYRPWKPSLHMPRVACRLVLRVIDCQPQRLQQISQEDARAEGCPAAEPDAVAWFRHLWDRLRGQRGHTWDENPWVWVVKFQPIDSKNRATR